MLGLQIVRITDCRISDSLEKALKPPKSHVLRSGLTVHQHELLAVRNPFSEISAFSCLKMSGGKTKGCWERDRVVGKYLGKSRDYHFYRILLLGIIWVKGGDYRFRILPMFL